MRKLRLTQGEIKLNVRLASRRSERLHLRAFLANDSGYRMDLHLYREVPDHRSGQMTFQSFGPTQGPLHGTNVIMPYPTKDFIQVRRFIAQINGTTYIYDFPDLFRQAMGILWREHWRQNGQSECDDVTACMAAVEMALGPNDQLVEVNRGPGENTVGMVAWKMTLKTPEFPTGRDVVVVGNDLTFNIGSFGPREDLLFKRASSFARSLGVPLINLSANSGARLGLVEELIPLFRVAWEDPDNPDKGFRYLYMSPDDYKKLSSDNIVHAQLIEDDGEPRYKINSITGEEGTGFDCMSGAGLVAGEMSLAYDKIVTMSLVSCRSIGIGAYLVRLSQRVVQVDNSHVIMTGASALNKVLGREVYMSNFQLGGVEIMHNNGVTHAVASDDFTGVTILLRWLSYMPKMHNGPPAILPGLDTPDRDIDFVPTRSAYDPRWLLAGRPDPDDPDVWQTGFFDRGSWLETMAPWAPTVLCGRARLGGIPMGVICPETRSVEVTIPADPANLDWDAKVVQQAGQVWYPDSAYKTSAAINDFNREQLPLFLFASFRGFSGRMKDLYDMILKFGSYIVDGLRQYTQPVLIYIPPCADMRGGALAVLDSRINPEYMEMYADEDSRCGILEPEGTVEIKFRQNLLNKTMQRLDPVCKDLQSQLDAGGLTKEQKEELEARLKDRQTLLTPMYRQVALIFAELHDLPEGMLDKKCINGIVHFKTSRRFFYHRLRRLLLEDQVKRRMREVRPTLSSTEIKLMLSRWFAEQHAGHASADAVEENRAVADWLRRQLEPANWEQSPICAYIRRVQRINTEQQMQSLIEQNPELSLSAILQIGKRATAKQRSEFIQQLTAIDNVDSID